MAFIGLTSGACRNLLTTKVPDYNCVVQVRNIKESKPSPGSAESYYYIELSDRENYVTAVLHPHLHQYVDDDGDEDDAYLLRKHTMLRIENFIRTISDKGITSLIIHNVRPLKQLSYAIGHPTLLTFVAPMHAISSSQNVSTQNNQQPLTKFFDKAALFYPHIANAPFMYITFSKSSRPTYTPLCTVPRLLISEITLNSTRFFVRGRITRKSPVSTHEGPNGSYNRQLLTLHDESGEIGAVVWKAAVRYSKELKVGSVYALYNATILVANPAYNTVDNSLQLNFNANAIFEDAEDDGSIPAYFFQFITVEEVRDLGPNSYCDIRGIIKSVGDGVRFKAKNSQQTTSFLEVYIVDDTMYMVRVCVWEDYRDEFEGQAGRAVSIKGLKYDYRQGPSLMTKSGRTQVVFDDDDPAHQALLTWYASQNKTTWHSLSGRGTAAGYLPDDATSPLAEYSIAEAKELGMGESSEPDTFIVVAEAEIVPHADIGYYACSQPDCHKRAVYKNNVWYCNSCQRSFKNPRYLYNLTIRLDDGGPETIECTSFDELEEREEFDQYLELVKGKYKVTITAQTVTKTLPNGNTFVNENWVITHMVPDGPRD